jgi:hypothetical protein
VFIVDGTMGVHEVVFFPVPADVVVRYKLGQDRFVFDHQCPMNQVAFEVDVLDDDRV